MTRKRPEAFAVALDCLRAELRAGMHPASARLTAGEIAERLHLSPTPVREALSRLAGEGLLDDRRGQGVFVVQLNARDLERLFRLQMALLLIACSDAPARTPGAFERLECALDEIEGSEALQLLSEELFRYLAASASQALARHLVRLQDQLAPVRRLEPHVLASLEVELAGLFDAARRNAHDDLRAGLKAFHARRVNAAETFAQMMRSAQI